MKIVMIFDGLQMGGIEKVGVDYSRLFTNLGYEVHIINLVPNQCELEKLFFENCKIHNFKLGRNIIFQRYAKLIEYNASGAVAYAFLALGLKIVLQLKKVLARIKFRSINKSDIVIAFSGHYNDLYFVANDFVKSDYKIAWIHGCEIEYKVISDGFFALYKRIKNLICLSDYGDVFCGKYNLINDINKIKLYNPISITKTKIDIGVINELKKKYGKFCLMVGRLDNDKDHITAIRAVEYLNKKNDLHLHLLLVGDGTRRKEYEKYIIDNKCEKYVHLIGQRNDVQNFYAAASIYVHASPMEGLPTVLLEALSYHLPIVATDSVPGVREILGDNECGLISPIFDYIGLASSIEKVIFDDDLRTKLINNGNKRIKDFNIDCIQEKIEEVFKSLK